MDEASDIIQIGKLSDELFVLKEVTWKIPTSKIRFNFLDYDVRSPPFSFADANWVFHLFPYGRTGSNSIGCITIEIERLDSRIQKHCVRYKSCFITDQKKEFSPIRVTRCFTPKCKTGWLLYIQKDSFFLDEKIIANEGVLSFRCQMRIPVKNGNAVFSDIELAVSGLNGSVSRQNSQLSTLESTISGLNESISRLDSMLSTAESTDSSLEASVEEPKSPMSTGKDSLLEISVEEPKSPMSIVKETPEEKPELPTSTSKGCDFATQHSTILPDSKMLQDFKNLFLKQEDCDVIINVKGQEFLAHRNILRARSPVFASTFRNDMKERATGVVDIEDCDPSSFSEFLCYLYCGNTENITVDNVYSLFTVADKYDVQDLRSECLEFLKENLSVDNFCETVTLAFRYFEKELIELTSDFFAKNLQEIIVTVKWQSFIAENPIQSNEVMIKALVYKKN